MALLVANVVWPGDDGDERAVVAAHLGVTVDRIVACKAVKKSLDARQRTPRWQVVFRVEVVDQDAILATAKRGTARLWTDRDDGRYGLVDLAPKRRTWPSDRRPIVVGAGPAGLFAALWLAEAGASVILIERGGKVRDRVGAVNGFWRGKLPLDPENNLVFGEGGAGTFSDGKIYTRRRDGELGFIFTRLVDFGADPDVLREAWAHLGTDRIRALLPAFRARLEALGVELRYDTRVDELIVEDGICRGVIVDGDTALRGGPVLMAVGHSARDTLRMLVRAGVAAEQRPIAAGVRVEHPQALIDRGRHGAHRDTLPPATYRLAHNPVAGRKAHTFCMCPGGMVVPATNHAGRVVVNGMSFAARRAYWANSAVIVEVRPADYGNADPLAGFAWQDRIEQACFRAAGGTYAAPAQRVTDLLGQTRSESLPRTSFPMGIVAADLRDLLPAFLVAGMADALRTFDEKLPGFAGPDAVLIAPETRTTSPVRFLRDARQCSTTVEDLFPIGEGAGYGGGIISSALDGIRAARAIADR